LHFFITGITLLLLLLEQLYEKVVILKKIVIVTLLISRSRSCNEYMCTSIHSSVIVNGDRQDRVIVGAWLWGKV